MRLERCCGEIQGSSSSFGEVVYIAWGKVALPEKIKSVIKGNEKSVSMMALKEKFFQQFLSPMWKSERFEALMNCYFLPGDTARDFVNRMAKLFIQNEIPWNTPSPEHGFLRAFLFYRCPQSVQLMLNGKDPIKDFVSPYELCEVLCLFPSIPPDVVLKQRQCMSCSKTLTCTCHGAKRKRDTESEKNQIFCKFHNELGNHSSDVCTKNPARISPANKTPEPRRENRVCTYCNKPRDFIHRCQEYRDAKALNDDKNPVFAMIDIKDPAELTSTESFGISDYGDILEEDMYYLENPSNFPDVVFENEEVDMDVSPNGFAMVEVKSLEKKYIWAPVTLNGYRCLAAIDSMATISFLSPQFAHQVGCDTMQVPGKLLLAKKNVSVSRVSTKDLITVRIGSKPPIMHPFDVLDMPKGVNCVLGLDLFEKVGITISGLPMDFPTLPNKPTSVPFVPAPVEQDLVGKYPILYSKSLASLAGSLDFANKKDSNYSVIYSIFQKKFRQELVELLDANDKLVGFCNHPLATVSFPTGDNAPVSKRQYPVPFKLRPEVDSFVNKGIANGTVEVCVGLSMWNCPLLVVPKRNPDGTIGGWRVCIDPRLINTLLPSISFPLPLIRELLEKLKGAIVFTQIDLTQGYLQFKVSPEDRDKTTFTWNGKQYRFIGVPFGFKHIPAIFQKVMSDLFKAHQFILVYLDNIIVFSTTFLEHIHHVRIALKILHSANLRVNHSKCEFAFTKMVLLGYHISADGIRIAKDKLLLMDAWSRPTTGNMLERHLGFFNFFRELIPMYSKLLAPLEKLRKQTVTVWNSSLESVYTTVRSILSSDILLAFPDFSLPFCVATDASNFGIGAVLYQIVNDKTRYISFAARALQSGEKNYGASKRELLAIVFALESFTYYLYANPFTLYTDHRALVYIFTQKHTNAMINNWLETLLAFDFSIVHRPGIVNVLPDKLSRFYDCDPVEARKGEEQLIWSIMVEDHIEFQLSPKIFHKISLHFGLSSVDAFSTPTNAQISI